MLWFYYTLASVIFFTSLYFIQKTLATESKNPRATAVIFNVFAILSALIIFVITRSYNSFVLPSNPEAWIFLGVACFCYGMFERGRFYAAKLIDVSILAIISNVSLVVGVLGSFIIYTEVPTFGKLLGGVLILIALILVSYTDSKKSVSLKGVLFGILMYTFLGLGWMLDKKGALYFNTGTYNLLAWSLPFVFIYFPYVKISHLKLEFKKSSWRLILMAVINVLAYVLQLKALTLQESSRIIPIVQTSTIFAVLIGIFLLKERSNLKRKIFAGILCILGVYLLM